MNVNKYWLHFQNSQCYWHAAGGQIYQPTKYLLVRQMAASQGAKFITLFILKSCVQQQGAWQWKKLLMLWVQHSQDAKKKRKKEGMTQGWICSTVSLSFSREICVIYQNKGREAADFQQESSPNIWVFLPFLWEEHNLPLQIKEAFVKSGQSSAFDEARRQRDTRAAAGKYTV